MFLLFLICKIVASVPKSEYNDRPRTLAGTLLILSLLFCFVGYLGNTDENLHRRLRMEQLFNDGRYEDLLEYGRYEEESDPGIDLLRAKSMLALQADPKGSAIGDMLFRYSISDPKALSRSLRKMDKTQTYLASCLLNGDIWSFRDSINLEDYKTMPCYYMQALVLANDSLASARFPQQFKDEQECYDSFLKDLDAVSAEKTQYKANASFINYHETYFWFYTFKR